MKNIITLRLSILLLLIGCEKSNHSEELKNPELFHQAVENLTDISVYDIFSPPVASRVYVYPAVAAYEIMVKDFPQQYRSLAGKLKGLKPIPDPDKKINSYLSSLYAFNTVGKALIFSERKMEKYA